MRDNLDPYRTENIHEVQRLLAAAPLALANSAAYAQRREVQTMIRQLYQHLQVAQDMTAAALARELHDGTCTAMSRRSSMLREGATTQ